MAPREDGLPAGKQSSQESTPGDDPVSQSVGPHIVDSEREIIGQKLAELEAEETAAMEPIRSRRLELKRLWNRSLPIQQLSDEILVEIFARFPHTPQRRRRDQYKDGQPTWMDLGWPGLMLVCHDWRELLVSTPMFWRQVNVLRQPSWTRLCLTRSAPGPISVHVGGNFEQGHLDDIPLHANRYKYFQYSDQFNLTASIETFTPLFNKGMPLLENLWVTVRDWDTSKPHFDAQITSQRFPSLRVLMLRSTIMAAPQETSLYAQLRKLTLCDCPPSLSLDGFLDALSASVQLEKVILQGVLHRLLGEWPHGDRVPHRSPISLPRLQNFKFYEYRIDLLSYFLAHLRLQPSVVHWIKGCTGVSHRRGVGKTIHEMLPPNRALTLPVLSLATDINMTIRGDQYSIGCGHAAPSNGHLLAGDSEFPRVLLMLTRGHYSRHWDKFMAQGLGDLVDAFGSSPLTRLTVGGDQSNSTAAAWERVFRTFPLLEELDLDGRRVDDASDVCDVFRGLHAASAPHSESGCTVACPTLREIRLSGVASAATYEAMRECLRYRGDKGVVLESLKMKALADWHSFDYDVDALRRGFTDGISDVVKSIDDGKTMSEVMAEYRALDDLDIWQW